MTNVTTPQKLEYSFQYPEITPPAAKEDAISILEILNNKKEWDSVVVTAKITQLNKTIAAGKNKLALSEAVGTHKSALMAFDILEVCITQVSLRELFTFPLLQVRVWSRKKLSTTNQTYPNAS